MGTELAKEQSTDKQSAWLNAAIDKLWERFENRYGSLWMDRWAGLPMARVKAEWADELRGFSSDAIRHGFDVTKGNRFPPTLPEFSDACRDSARRAGTFQALPAPTIDKETARQRLQEIKRRMTPEAAA